LALVLGIVGRRHVSGKIGMLGGVVVLVLALTAATMAFLRYSAARGELQKRLEEAVAEEEERLRAITEHEKRFEKAKEAPEPGPRKNGD
jgi:hypothetical protein